MADPQVIEGTWEEVARQAAELAGSGRRVKLIILSDSSEAPAPPENAAAIALLDEWFAEDRAVSTEEREEADEEDPTVALLAQWDQEDSEMTLEEVDEARRDFEEFKRNVNAERVRAGAHPVYP